MEDKQPITKAAKLAKVSRTSIWEWIRLGLLKSRNGPKVRNLSTTLVSMKEVRELAKSRRPGRPKKQEAK